MAKHAAGDGQTELPDRILATYRVRSDAASIMARAEAIAVEQSVEMPLAAIDERRILDEVVGRVEAITDRGGGMFDVSIGLAVETVGDDAGQLLNMLFGNSSLQEDVTLVDVAVPPSTVIALGGPRAGIGGIRTRAGAEARALTCSALKPLGLAPERLAGLAERLARGGIDFVKDDHGLADQRFSRFAARVPAVAEAVHKAAAAAGRPTRYVPSLSGDLERMRRELALARAAGIDTVMISPVLAGFATAQTIIREHPDFAFFAHPTMGGAARIAPALLVGKLFRLLGADAVIFPTYGGRFGYSEAACRTLAENARAPWHGLAPSLPVPAGGITLDRIAETLDFYGKETMLLVGGSLLLARERLAEEAAAFTRTVACHVYEQLDR